jgi:DNA topoisomerase-3
MEGCRWCIRDLNKFSSPFGHQPVGQLVQQYRGATLSLKLPPAPACPQCGAPMQQRTGKSGAFWSCSRYPDCKGTLPIESPTGRRSAPRKRRAASKAS